MRNGRTVGFMLPLKRQQALQMLRVTSCHIYFLPFAPFFPSHTTQLESVETGAYGEACVRGNYRPIEFLQGGVPAVATDGAATP